MPDRDGPVRASVVIRSRNDEAYIGRTLEMLSSQSVSGLELISVDNDSSDATKKIVASFPHVLRLDAPAPYIPGRVLNFAVRAASAPLVVFNNSDAVPLDRFYIERLIEPFSDPSVGAVYGNQLPRPDAFPLVRKDSERAFGDGKAAASWRHFFSLASSAARRGLILENPFDESLQYSEDIEWSYRMKRRGVGIVYAKDARVEHSHNYTIPQMRKRFYNEGFADYAIYHEAPAFPSFLRGLCAETLRDILYLCRRGEFASLLSQFSYRFTQRFSAWRGARDARISAENTRREAEARGKEEGI